METAADSGGVTADGGENPTKEFDNKGAVDVTDGGAGEVAKLEEGGGNGMATGEGGAEPGVSSALNAKVPEDEADQ